MLEYISPVRSAYPPPSHVPRDGPEDNSFTKAAIKTVVRRGIFKEFFGGESLNSCQ